MKKIIGLLVLAMAVAVVGCGSGNNNSCSSGQVMSTNNGCVQDCGNGNGIIGGQCQSLSAPAINGGGCSLQTYFPTYVNMPGASAQQNGSTCCLTVNGNTTGQCMPLNNGYYGNNTGGYNGYPNTGFGSNCPVGWYPGPNGWCYH